MNHPNIPIEITPFPFEFNILNATKLKFILNSVDVWVPTYQSYKLGWKSEKSEKTQGFIARPSVSLHTSPYLEVTLMVGLIEELVWLDQVCSDSRYLRVHFFWIKVRLHKKMWGFLIASTSRYLWLSKYTTTQERVSWVVGSRITLYSGVVFSVLKPKQFINRLLELSFFYSSPSPFSGL